MAGLAPHPDRFFKYLFILVLYSLAMVQFVRKCFQESINLELMPLVEFCTGRSVQERRDSYSLIFVVELVHDDLCWVL